MSWLASGVAPTNRWALALSDHKQCIFLSSRGCLIKSCTPSQVCKQFLALKCEAHTAKMLICIGRSPSKKWRSDLDHFFFRAPTGLCHPRLAGLKVDLYSAWSMWIHVGSGIYFDVLIALTRVSAGEKRNQQKKGTPKSNLTAGTLIWWWHSSNLGMLVASAPTQGKMYTLWPCTSAKWFLCQQELQIWPGSQIMQMILLLLKKKPDWTVFISSGLCIAHSGQGQHNDRNVEYSMLPWFGFGVKHTQSNENFLWTIHFTAFTISCWITKFCRCKYWTRSMLTHAMYLLFLFSVHCWNHYNTVHKCMVNSTLVTLLSIACSSQSSSFFSMARLRSPTSFLNLDAMNRAIMQNCRHMVTVKVSSFRSTWKLSSCRFWTCARQRQSSASSHAAHLSRSAGSLLQGGGARRQGNCTTAGSMLWELTCTTHSWRLLCMFHIIMLISQWFSHQVLKKCMLNDNSNHDASFIQNLQFCSDSFSTACSWLSTWLWAEIKQLNFGLQWLDALRVIVSQLFGWAQSENQRAW